MVNYQQLYTMLPWKHQVVCIDLWTIFMTFAYVLQRFMPFIHRESANSNINCQHLHYQGNILKSCFYQTEWSWPHIQLSISHLSSIFSSLYKGVTTFLLLFEQTTNSMYLQRNKSLKVWVANFDPKIFTAPQSKLVWKYCVCKWDCQLQTTVALYTYMHVEVPNYCLSINNILSSTAFAPLHVLLW